MNLLALDLSLTSTGWAAKHRADPVASGTFCPPAAGGAFRLEAAVTWLDRMLDVWHPDLVLIEGYSFASKFSRAHALGELGGVIRLHLHQNGLAWVELAPKVRAKLATGKGNAGKEQVLAEAIRRLGYAGHSNDEADALWLLEAGIQRYGLPGAVSLPEAHRAVLASADWPLPPMRRAS